MTRASARVILQSSDGRKLMVMLGGSCGWDSRSMKTLSYATGKRQIIRDRNWD